MRRENILSKHKGVGIVRDSQSTRLLALNLSACHRIGSLGCAVLKYRRMI
jgi:hypothetical protein